MYCKKCGVQIEDDSTYCPYCGEITNSSANANTQINNNGGNFSQPSNNNNGAEYNVSKAGIGVIMSLFLGLLGLIIGVLIYPSGTVARKTFVKGWLITWAVCSILVVIFYVLLFSAVMADLPY